MKILTPGLLSYEEGLKLQKKIHAKRAANLCEDTLILLEHTPVYTLGKNAKAENILASEDWLKNEEIEIHQSDRGGDVTYHGPGQLVGYPIFNLEKRGLGVRNYVYKLEEMIINTLKEFDIKSTRNPDYPGVWVGNNKIAALGIRLHKDVSMHGFALNVNPDLRHYDGILACGIQNRGITSIQQEIHSNISVATVMTVVVRQMEIIF